MARVLALEPWYSGSHRNFLDGFTEHSSHEFETVTMAARFWKWRMQGGAVTLSRKTRELVDSGFAPDVVFATDMVNVPAYLALTRDVLQDVPVVVYFHENQLTYPMPAGEDRDYTYSYINYLSCLAADRILFNSSFHRDEFLEALPVLLRTFPDYTHLNSVNVIRDRSDVLHLGMDLKRHDQFRDSRTSATHGRGRTLTVLWNQRWEYDKNPEGFFRVMNRLDDAGSKFNLILAGEHFEEQPYEFERAFERYAQRILHYGYAENFEEYSRLLHRADIVMSTSLHEFFGVAIMEAIYCGCHPLLPDKLSYPELIPDSLRRPLLHAPLLYDDEDHLFRIAADLLAGRERPLPVSSLKGIPAHLDWDTQVSAFDEALSAVVDSRSVLA
jgi:glycosyltransferase involved in cell wall biosynthesis